MRWLVYAIVGFALFWVWMFFGSAFHCPSCGIELPRKIGQPWTRVDHCRCGWRRERA